MSGLCLSVTRTGGELNRRRQDMRSHGAEMDELDGGGPRLQGARPDVTHVVFSFYFFVLGKKN